MKQDTGNSIDVITAPLSSDAPLEAVLQGPKTRTPAVVS